MALASPPTAIAELRRWLGRVEAHGRTEQAVLPFGLDAIDRSLPQGGLPLGHLHEVIEAGAASEYAGIATLFIAGILARLSGPVLWCLRGRDLFAPALARIGLHPDRVIYCETWKDRDVLPAMEEGLRCAGLAAVVGEVTRLSLSSSRRLQLCAEESGVTALVLRRWRNTTEKELAGEPNAAATRWRISPHPSLPGGFDGLERQLWHVELLRLRGGEPHSWIVEACNAEGHAPPRDKPLVTARMEGQRRVLASVDRAAERLGLACGMTVTHAQSLVPDLTVVDAKPEEDEAALDRLGLWCVMYSPLVTPDPPDGLFIDVAGSTHLFHGEIALMEDLCKRLKQAGISGRAAISDTPACSWAVARYGENMHVPPGRASEAIASLPVASLRIAPRTVVSLHEVGIERVAHLASKPRSSLHLRFGGEVLLRLDQAMGSAAEVLTSLVPPEVPRSELRFAEPLSDPEDLKRVIERLCEDLCRDLETRGAGARRLDLVFLRVDNLAQAVRIGLSRPYREPKHLAKLLAERLVLVDPGFGIESASLTGSWVEAITERQTVGRHVGADGADVDVSQLVDTTLGVRLGQNKIFRLTPVESALPERAVRRVPALHPAQGVAWPKDLPRPARLFERPEKVEAVAELPDHPPRLFVWRNRPHRVARADGPERIHGEWWVSADETNLIRDYYRVETADGSRYWLFRDGPAGQGGNWWLHGVGEA